MRKLSKNKIKIGILGGTFDPPHIGHLYISRIAVKKLKLNKLIWAVTKKNPMKKKPYLKINTRVKLSKKLVKSEEKIFVRYLDNKIKSTWYEMIRKWYQMTPNDTNISLNYPKNILKI